MYATVFNPGNSPVAVGGGRTLGGGEWGTVETTDQEVKDLLDAGSLVLVKDAPTGDDLNPAAVAAHERTALLTERAETAAALDKPYLQRLAEKRGEDVTDVGVDELRRDLVERVDLEVPTKKQKASGSGAGNGNQSSGGGDATSNQEAQ